MCAQYILDNDPTETVSYKYNWARHGLDRLSLLSFFPTGVQCPPSSQSLVQHDLQSPVHVVKCCSYSLAGKIRQSHRHCNHKSRPSLEVYLSQEVPPARRGRMRYCSHPMALSSRASLFEWTGRAWRHWICPHYSTLAQVSLLSKSFSDVRPDHE